MKPWRPFIEWGERNPGGCRLAQAGGVRFIPDFITEDAARYEEVAAVQSQRQAMPDWNKLFGPCPGRLSWKKQELSDMTAGSLHPTLLSLFSD